MKYLIVILCVTNLNAQIKVDTIYSGRNMPSNLCYSKMNKILDKIPNKCIGTKFVDTFDFVESNTEYHTMWILNALNKEGKTGIFKMYDVFVVAYFCEDIDPPSTDIYLFEFHYDTPINAANCMVKLKLLSQKKDFWEYITTKNWYFKQKENIVYFLLSGIEDKDNPMKIEIQKRLEKL